MTPETETYQGFEQGPIRPPSEAGSLLVRVMRNCPWNQCTFCPVYKHNRFSRRPLEHIKRDLEAVSAALPVVRQSWQTWAGQTPTAIQGALAAHGLDPVAAQAARHWLGHGAHSVFLQDADVFILKPGDLREILAHLHRLFPQVERVTCYARSRSAARLEPEDLRSLREAGLARVHIGLESGSDTVLKRVRKGVTQKQQIVAGQKLKAAGLELSEYYMPGLGGAELWEENARATAAAINEINPDFIRIRTLALPPDAPLAAAAQAGQFDMPTDELMARELLLFLESLHGVTSVVHNDHIVNLLPEVEGRLPADRERLISLIDNYLALPPPQRLLYQVGRRLGYVSRLEQLAEPELQQRLAELCRLHRVTPANVDAFTVEVMRRYI
jgi:hypothetical protein